jgi:hypothetical protein
MTMFMRRATHLHGGRDEATPDSRVHPGAPCMALYAGAASLTSTQSVRRRRTAPKVQEEQGDAEPNESRRRLLADRRTDARSPSSVTPLMSEQSLTPPPANARCVA